MITNVVVVFNHSQPYITPPTPVQQTTMQTSPAKQEANNEELGMRVNTEDEAGVAGADDEE